MKKLASILTLGGIVLISLPALAQGDKAAQEAEMMAAWQEMMTPGPHHQALATHAGDWEVHSSMKMDPSSEPMMSDGTAHLEMVANGLFLQETVNAPMMGMPWTGYGVSGFDKALNKHVGIWYDSAGTMIMNFQGDCTDDCSTITMTANFVDPMTKQPSSMKTVTKMTDRDHATNQLYTMMDGKEWMMGEITYTRKK